MRDFASNAELIKKLSLQVFIAGRLIRGAVNKQPPSVSNGGTQML
ncbi:hypothetical protein [Verrucomicrobium sp. BvORR034]|nr:hypothetical protein [Verrucomicrobium sp. BvORR034]